MSNSSLIPQDVLTRKLLVDVLAAMAQHYLEHKSEAAGADEFGDQAAPAAGTTDNEAGRTSIVGGDTGASNNR